MRAGNSNVTGCHVDKLSFPTIYRLRWMLAGWMHPIVAISFLERRVFLKPFVRNSNGTINGLMCFYDGFCIVLSFSLSRPPRRFFHRFEIHE